MNVTLIDYPVYIPTQEYDRAAREMTEQLKRLSGVISIYQVGSITDPGISDIDMLVVFKDGIKTDFNPLARFSSPGNYIFTHQLFGLHEPNFRQARDYFFFHHYKLLFGREINAGQPGFTEPDIRRLKQQIAYEYLVKSYITLTLQLTYRIVKLRPLLLEARANLYDLEFLGVKSGKMFNLVNTLINWRTNWFDNPPARQGILEWLEEFYRELVTFLKENLEIGGFYHIPAEKYRFSRNIVIRNHPKLFFSHKGFILFPGLAALWGKRFFNLHHRFNRFVFHIPVGDVDTHQVLKKKLEFETFCTDSNKKTIPFFAPLRSSLDISPVHK